MASFLLRRRFCNMAQPSITYSTVYTKLKAEPNPGNILKIFDSISGDPSTSAAANARELAVKILAKKRRHSDIETLIEKQKRDCKNPTEKFIVSTIYSYGRAGMIDHAIRTFEQMEGLGIPPSVLSFNALLGACNKAKKFHQVPKLFSEIPKNLGISPNTISYGILVKSLCESGSIESAFSILREMEKKIVEADIVIYTTILDGCYKYGMPELAKKILAEMGEKGFSLDLGYYNARVLYYATHGNIEEVLRLMGEMVSAGVEPNTDTYGLLMTCYYKNNMIEEARKAYKDMEANGCSLNADIFCKFVYNICKNGDYVFGLFVSKRCAKQNMKLDFAALKCLIEGLMKDSKFKQSRGSINDIKQLIETAKRKLPYRLKELEKLETAFDVNMSQRLSNRKD